MARGVIVVKRLGLALAEETKSICISLLGVGMGGGSDTSARRLEESTQERRLSICVASVAFEIETTLTPFS